MRDQVRGAFRFSNRHDVYPGSPRPGIRERRWPVALGLAAGAALDAVIGDPRRGHPVALFGRAAAALESRDHADSRPRGAAHAAAAVLAVAVPAVLIQRGTRAHPLLRFATVAATTWAVTGARSLRHEAERAHAALSADDLAAAREILPSLCGRDPANLGSKEIARAVIESVAENTSDAVVAPLFWGAVAGLPGLVAYRAINTLDAMVGHRSPRYERFGWASARLDDVANYLPARATALLTAACAPLVTSPTHARPALARPAAHPRPTPPYPALARPGRPRARPTLARLAHPRARPAQHADGTIGKAEPRPVGAIGTQDRDPLAPSARSGGGAVTAIAETWRVTRIYGSHHPSPNAGQCEAAFAGALGIRLGGTNVYHGVAQTRPELGDGRPPETDDIRRAIALSRAVTAAAAATAAVTAAAITSAATAAITTAAVTAAVKRITKRGSECAGR